MNYEQAINTIALEKGVEHSTMMKTPCLRYRGSFMAMMFEKADALIIKVSPKRVDDLIFKGKSLEFNFTKKRFKEWVLIPMNMNHVYESH